MYKNTRLTVFLLCLFIVACSSTPDKDPLYLKSRGTAALEVPPDLVLPAGNETFKIPGIASQQKTYLDYSGKGSKQPLLPKPSKGVRLVRQGNLAWLEINASPKKLWSELQVFLTKIGYELKREDRLTGLLETSWIENKAAESGWFSDTVGIMDKFRVRLERGEKKNTTLVFVRHRGMSGTRADGGDEDRVIWQPRPSDPELEVEILQKFLVYRGLSSDQVKQLAVGEKQLQNSRIVTDQKGTLTLEVDENFARTWRRVGLALDRMGLLIDDRNRSAGVYYIRVPESYELAEEKGWFTGLFSKDDALGKAEYLLSVRSKENKTVVVLRQRSSSKIDEAISKKILSRIQAHIS